MTVPAQRETENARSPFHAEPEQHAGGGAMVAENWAKPPFDSGWAKEGFLMECILEDLDGLFGISQGHTVEFAHLLDQNAVNERV